MQNILYIQNILYVHNLVCIQDILYIQNILYIHIEYTIYRIFRIGYIQNNQNRLYTVYSEYIQHIRIYKIQYSTRNNILNMISIPLSSIEDNTKQNFNVSHIPTNTNPKRRGILRLRNRQFHQSLMISAQHKKTDAASVRGISCISGKWKLLYLHWRQKTRPTRVMQTRGCSSISANVCQLYLRHYGHLQTAKTSKRTGKMVMK